MRAKKWVCLFGLSADPPTGEGGHAGIVRALLSLPLAPDTGNDENDANDANDGGPGGVNDERGNDANGGGRGNGSTPDEGDRGARLLPYAFDEVWVLPVYRHTFPNKQERLASFEDRCRMCELAFSDLSGDVDPPDAVEEEKGDEDDGLEEKESMPTSPPPRTPPRVRISAAERDSWRRAARHLGREPSAVGTAALADHLDAEYPGHDFSLCLGEDSFRDLVAGRWKEGPRVLSRFRNRLWVVPRVPDGIGGEDGSIASDGANDALRMHGARWLPVPGATDVSSSRVRALTYRGVVGVDGNGEVGTALRDLVAPAVLNYMEEHRLYGFSDVDRPAGGGASTAASNSSAPP